ncbi:MAG: twitching motility protein PilT [Frankiaceae bacterium]|jgi:hypothetical protein|nr:twitching motility protein PilT [Frankiaceae bacterium]
MTGFAAGAGPLLQLDRNDRKVIALLALAESAGDPITIPGAALAQAMRDPARQARLSRLLKQPRTTVVPLGSGDAIGVGQLLAASGTTDIAGAHVVICARRAHQSIVTSDPDDLHALDPRVNLIVL